MKQTEEQKINHYKQGNRPEKSKACEILKGLKPGIYSSFRQAGIYNKTYGQYLKAICDGKFSSKMFEVRLIE